MTTQNLCNLELSEIVISTWGSAPMPSSVETAVGCIRREERAWWMLGVAERKWGSELQGAAKCYHLLSAGGQVGALVFYQFRVESTPAASSASQSGRKEGFSFCLIGFQMLWSF